MKTGLFFGFLLAHFALAQQGNLAKSWLTLNGEEPVVIARGGFSGLFPDSSSDSYKAALQQSKPGTIMFCDMQLTKDSLAVCHSGTTLDNSTNLFIPQQIRNVNGQAVTGWFTIDYTLMQLNVLSHVIQSVPSRTYLLNSKYSIQTPEYVTDLKPSPRLWMNVQYDTFYNQYNKSLSQYIGRYMAHMDVDYISSPEIGFLKAMGAKITNKTKPILIFRFLNHNETELTTNVKYGDLLGDLTTVKTFASGILVPKEYIWPVNEDLYLLPTTTLVTDAHELGLRVFVSGFANDFKLSHNYSFDPTSEYLQFIDNSKFSVDGFLTDFPPTASEAISCLAQIKNVSAKTRETLVISHNGASGDYPGCSDLAYEKAIADGADIIDCTVQLSKDGVPFCLDSPDLTGKTTAAMTFTARSTSIPEIQSQTGIFSFDLTWNEIRSLKPQIVSPFAREGLVRNPKFKYHGKLISLPEFLDLAETKANVGVLITIQNAAYLASERGFNVVDTVISALSNTTFDKQTTQKVLIQSDDSFVLRKFKDFPNYQRVLLANTLNTSGLPSLVAEDIKKYAEAVNIPKSAIILHSRWGSISTGATNVVEEMSSANISVYVSGFMNEYANILIDHFYDPYTELATYLAQHQILGVITDHPKSASAFMRTRCTNSSIDLPYNILPVHPGDFRLIIGQIETPPPAPAPAPEPTPPTTEPPIVGGATNNSVASNNSGAIEVAAPPASSSHLTIATNFSIVIDATLLTDSEEEREHKGGKISGVARNFTQG